MSQGKVRVHITLKDTKGKDMASERMLAPQLPKPAGNASVEQPGSEVGRWLAPRSQEELRNKAGWNHFNGKLCHKIPACGEQRPSQQNVIFDENIFPNARSIILTLFRIKHFNILLENGSLHNMK